MSMHTTIWLGLTMGAIAIVNAGLMAWLWRFPMQPDPTGRDPHGVSTAPRSWTNVHRALGYVFALVYLALLIEMVPRAWEFRVASAASVLHGVLGLLLGILLTIKIAIIRHFRHFGNRLPWIGGTLATTTLLVVGLVMTPAWRVVQPLTPLSLELNQGRNIVSRKCVQCHGASIISSEREDARKWDRITHKMQRYSYEIPGKNPITEDERMLATAYLARTLSEANDRREDPEDEQDHPERATENENRGRQRRRRSGRD